MTSQDKRLLQRFNILNRFTEMERNEPDLINNFSYDSSFNAWPFVRLSMMQEFWSASPENHFPYLRMLTNIQYITKTKLYLLHETKNTLKKVKTGSCTCITSDVYHKLMIEDRISDQTIDPVALSALKAGLAPLKLQLAESEKYPRFIETLHVPYIQGKTSIVPPEQWIHLIPSYKSYVEACLDYGVFPLHIASIIQQCMLSNMFADIYVAIFRIIMPCCVCLSNYYQTTNHGVILACNRLQIPTAEFQHGLQVNHFAYKFGHIPPNGFEALPRWWFVWGEAPKVHLEKSLHSHTPYRVIDAGQPLYSMWHNGNIKDDSVLLQKLQNFTENKKIILFALSGEGEVELQMLPELIRRSPENWRWLIRNHPFTTPRPLELEDKYLYRIERDAASKLNLHTVFSYTDHCVTAISTTVFEAIYLHNIQSTFIDDCIYDLDKEYFGSIKRLGKCTELDAALDRIEACLNSKYVDDDSIPYISNNTELIGRVLKVICATAAKKHGIGV